MRKSILLGVVSIALMGLGGSVYAYGGGGGECSVKKEKRMRAKADRVMDKIDATDEQRVAIEAELDNAIASWVELRGATRAVPKELLNQWKEEAPDKEVIVRLVDERIEALRAAAYETIDSALAVHQTLEPAQREKVGEMMSRRMGKRGHRGER